MMVELIFHRNMLELDAGETQKRIETALSKIQGICPFKATVESVTIMSRWLVVLVNFNIPEPKFESPVPNYKENFQRLAFDTLAGSIVCELQDYAVRYRNFEIHGEGESLIFKKNWRRTNE